MYPEDSRRAAVEKILKKYSQYSKRGGKTESYKMLSYQEKAKTVQNKNKTHRNNKDPSTQHNDRQYNRDTGRY